VGTSDREQNDQRKYSEEALRDAGERYRILVEQIPAVTYIDSVDDPATPLYTSPQIEEMLGYTAEEWLEGRLWPKRLHPDDRERILLAADERFEKEGEGRFAEEYRLLAKDGSVVWVREEAVLVRHEGGGPLYWQGAIFDVTERKEDEEALRKSERRFAAIFEQVPVGMVQVRLDGSWVRFNDKFCEILGYTREELHTVDFRDILLPEDLERDLERGARMLGGELRDYSEEKLIRRKDGSRAWICLTLSLIRTSSGPEHFVGVIEDITEPKKTKEALTRSDILYRTVVEQAAENIFVVDLESKRILEANAALHRSLGYGPEELNDMVLYDIVAHDRQSIDENTKRTIAEGHCFIGERRYRRKDGTLVAVEVNVSSVLYDGREAMIGEPADDP